MKLTRQEIKDNRIKFATGLLEPHRKKFKGRLENIDNPNERCCIGHGCDIFGETRNVHTDCNQIDYNGSVHIAPVSLITKLGLTNEVGSIENIDTSNVVHVEGVVISKDIHSLAYMNDKTDMTTQQIGEWLSQPEIIEGGVGTPYLPLSDYEEGISVGNGDHATDCRR